LVGYSTVLVLGRCVRFIVAYLTVHFTYYLVGLPGRFHHACGSFDVRLCRSLDSDFSPQYKNTSLLVSNIIMLATPHSNPLYAFDKLVHDVHQQLLQTEQNNNTSNTLLVMISGGLQDKMIDLAVCQVNSNHPASLSFLILLPQLLLERGALGMEHQAIVWCHGVLHQVCRVIWALTRSKDRNVKEQRWSMEKALGKEFHQEDLQKLATTFQVSNLLVRSLREGPHYYFSRILC
jgi:hypothetical protein